MFRLTVRDRLMVAHSLPDPFFGPAQHLHGVTWVVEVTFERPDLDEHGVVLDIGAAGEALQRVLEPLNYSNLDDLEQFRGVLTTTERMAQHIGESLCVGMDLDGVTAVEVLLREHPDAWASHRLERTTRAGHRSP